MRHYLSLTLAAAIVAAVPAAPAAQTTQSPAPPSSPANVSQPNRNLAANDQHAQPFDPATYVRIYEETSDKRILLYDPARMRSLPTLLRIDADSKIVVELDRDRLGPDMALNGLYMAAELSRVASDSGPVRVEVMNYSEVATDPKTQASQAGVALRTAGQVHVVLQSLYDLTKDLIATIYEPECTTGQAPQSAGPPAGCAYRLKNASTPEQAEPELRDHLRTFQPRVDAILEFLMADANAVVIGEIGSEVFSLDLRALRATAAKLKADVALLIANEPSPGRVRARDDVMLTLTRLWNDMQPLRNRTRLEPQYFEKRWSEALLPHFHQLLAPGTIDLRRYKASDGEILTLMIQARAAGGEGGGGITRDFQFAVKKFHTRVTTDASALYLHRLGVVRDDKGQPISTNFAPAPGATFGAVFYSRGLRADGSEWLPNDTGASRLWSALAPGVGMNVSLMNFAANDFDPSITNAAGQVVGGFRTTNSTAIQVGAGVTASLFANAIQVTYGWNLNVAENRRYFGIGFGFIEVGQQIAKFVKK